MSIGIFILIGIVLFSLYYYFSGNKVDENALQQKDINTHISNETNKKIVTENDIKDIELQEEILLDDEGRKYKILNLVRELPRRTYILGDLNGKYWGEIDTKKETEFVQHKFFDFNIYEITVSNSIINNKTPFILDELSSFPRERLPKLLTICLLKDGKEYELNLHDPQIGNVVFNRKLHQDEGTEVFGTIDAIVTGYVLDFVVEHYTEKEYLISDSDATITQSTVISEIVLTKTTKPTGNVEYNGNYKRTEYFYSDYKNTYWSNWKFAKSSNNEGCLTSMIGLISIIFGIAFLLMILPSLVYILPFFLILLLLNILPAKIYRWMFGVFSIIVLIGFLASLFHFFRHSTNTFIPKPTIVENPKEQETQATPIIDTLNKVTKNDTLIKHYRVWKDYEGNKYEGYIWTKSSDYNKSKYYKKNLDLEQSTPKAYDEIIYLLKENDKQNLNGVYQLFDSIGSKNQLSNIKFVELLVSFVQDIPYAVILPYNCNANLYNDKFIQDYLNSENARCDGFEKFGINSPVEFMSNLYGDCDTRTLLLYTMLAHYGFDVALFSSEHYSHSIIGVNLPIDGIAYKHGNRRYVLWETTAPNIRGGILPKEISNLNYWRISLKSK